MSGSVTWHEVFRHEEDAERRVIFVGEHADGEIEIEERTDGEDTYVAYGSLAHVGKVVLSESSAQALQATSPDEGVCEIVAKKETLLDLMDFLDACDIAYTYISKSSNDIAFRSLQ